MTVIHNICQYAYNRTDIKTCKHECVCQNIPTDVNCGNVTKTIFCNKRDNSDFSVPVYGTYGLLLVTVIGILFWHIKTDFFSETFVLTRSDITNNPDSDGQWGNMQSLISSVRVRVQQCFNSDDARCQRYVVGADCHTYRWHPDRCCRCAEDCLLTMGRNGWNDRDNLCRKSKDAKDYIIRKKRERFYRRNIKKEYRNGELKVAWKWSRLNVQFWIQIIL